MSNFLFDDELDNELHNSTYGGRYLQMNADDDKFPVLIRRDSFPGIVSLFTYSLPIPFAFSVLTGAPSFRPLPETHSCEQKPQAALRNGHSSQPATLRTPLLQLLPKVQLVQETMLLQDKVRQRPMAPTDSLQISAV